MEKENIQDTNLVARELLKIERKYGLITAGSVVESARPKKSPLHKHFLWEDTRAAAEYRLWQARQLISIVKFQHPEMDDAVRLFTSVTIKKEVGGEEKSVRFYLKTETALADEGLRAQILERAKNEARSWATKYRNLVELAQLVNLIKTL